MYVIGTAGHVDHGKSTLVRALTGTDPDRLPEEQRRGMTIELGFAEWRLHSGLRVGMIDVPGHQRLVRTMVAGAHGIDVVLLVVAADEGVMPQTREHLAICELLGTRRGVVALTKADTVDAEMLELAAAEVADEVGRSALRGAPVVAVSGRTGAGLDALDAAVEAALAGLPARPDLGRPRLFVDRAFSLAGFGPVVTGTLEGGTLRAGAEVVILPAGTRARIRGVQRHGETVTAATPGGRTALNLGGVDLDRLGRGMAVALPGTLRATRRIDALLRCAPVSPVPLTHGAGMRLHLGTADTPARVWLLDAAELAPGEQGFAQLSLAGPVPIVPGDRLVLRRDGDSVTVGGGEVLDVAPLRHRRHDDSIAAALSDRRGAPTATLAVAALRSRRLGAEPAELGRLCGAGPAEVDAALRGVDGAVVRLGRRLLAAERWQDLAAASTALLEEHHANAPLAPGMAREEWRGRLRLPAAIAAEVAHRLAASGALEERGAEIGLPGRRPRVDARTRATADAIAALLNARGLDPPAPSELRAHGMTPGLLRLLVDEGRVVRLGTDVVLSATASAAARAAVEAHLAEHGTATVAALRDAVGATRRVMVPLLEHLDAQRVTLRAGDVRRLRGG